MELGEADAKGRRKPVGTGKFQTVPVSSVISAIGQLVDMGGIDEGTNMQFSRKGTVYVDSLSYQTGEPDIFAGGDVVTGPKFAIDAIAAGKEGAISIHRFVHPGQRLDFGRDRRDYKALDVSTAAVSIESFDTAPRQKAAGGAAAEAKKTFKDLRGVFTEEQLKKETERCLGCGAVIVDEYMCVGCGICTTKCKFDAIHLEKISDNVGTPYFQTLARIAGNVPVRLGTVAAKKIGFGK